jgi:hypothetical protein
LRVDLAVDWRERHGLLGCEHWLTLEQGRDIANSRYAYVQGSDGSGFLVLMLDGAESKVRALKKGGVHLATPLMQDPASTAFAIAYAPAERASVGAIESAWQMFAYPDRVPLFTSDDDAVIVAGAKPADDDDGVVVRVRECEGTARAARLRCGGRARVATSVDEHERDLPDAVTLEDAALVFSLAPYARRSFRVRF